MHPACFLSSVGHPFESDTMFRHDGFHRERERSCSSLTSIGILFECHGKRHRNKDLAQA